MKTIAKFIGAAFAAVTFAVGPVTANADRGDIFVSDAGTNAIYKCAPDGTVSAYATGLNQPYGLAFDSAGYLFEADDDRSAIYKFASDGTKTFFANAQINPEGLAFDSAGYLFAAAYNGTIYKFAPDGTPVGLLE